jgi:CAAX amino terminal protease family.
MAEVSWLDEKSLLGGKIIPKLMGRFNPFFLFLGSILLILFISGAFAHLGYKTLFYVWEFRIDPKPVAFAFLCYFFNKKFREKVVFEQIGLGKWDWSTNLLAFFFPLGILALIIVVGYLFKATDYQGVENSATFLLATLLDIPATYFFSITVVLLEEIVFRGFVFSIISKDKNVILSCILTSLLWATMSISNVLQGAGSHFTSILFDFLNLISLGFICSALFYFSKSIWSSYSFRIGLMVFSTALLGESHGETNSFFMTNLPVFSNGGIILTFLNFIFAFSLIRVKKGQQKLINSQIN